MDGPYHIIIDINSFNHLTIVSHSDFITKFSNETEVYKGSEDKCNEFHSHYTDQICYPIVELEELD